MASVESKSPTPFAVVMKTSMGHEILVSANYWKLLVPISFRSLCGFGAVMNDVLTDPAIQLRVLPDIVLASKVLGHANTVIAGLPQGCYFKIGLTVDPKHRYRNDAYGYAHERTSPAPWSSMILLAIFHHGEAAGVFEASLIASWFASPHCLNESGGGEAILKKGGPFFIYVVLSEPASAPQML